MIKKIDAAAIIKKRKELWSKYKDIEKDQEYRQNAAYYMSKKENKSLRMEIKRSPGLLIEMFFTVVDKEQNTVPFFLNEVQRELQDILLQAIKDFEAGKRNYIRFLLLKGRQQGFTTYISALQLAYAITRKNFAGFTLADQGENSTAIFEDKAKFVYDNLPDLLKPHEKANNRKELLFKREDGKGLNSRWRISTAGNKEVGRSKTLNFFHGSEAAFWDSISSITTGLGKALTKNCIAILESTANGYNQYKDLWDKDNNWECLFFEWWRTSEYRLNFESVEIERTFKDNVLHHPGSDNVDHEGWVYTRCRWLKDIKGLEWEQLYWYYNEWKDSREKIKQEFPCTPEESFLASGRNYFNTEKVHLWMSELKEIQEQQPYRQGYYEYKYGYDATTESKIIIDDSIKWIDSPTGYIKIYKEPEAYTGYSMGGDTATTGTDKNIAQVILPDYEIAATLTIEHDEDLFADQQYCLGLYYNQALIADEINHSTHPTKVLMERGYPNLYTRTTEPDQIAEQITKKVGLRTTQFNRPTMLGTLRTIVRENIQKIRNIETLQEMMSFIINEAGKPEAEEGKHDDYIMSYAIACYISGQQISYEKTPPEKLEGVYTTEELEDLGYTEYEIQRYHEGESLYIKEGSRWK